MYRYELKGNCIGGLYLQFIFISSKFISTKTTEDDMFQSALIYV